MTQAEIQSRSGTEMSWSAKVLCVRCGSSAYIPHAPKACPLFGWNRTSRRDRLNVS